jgi:carbon storage regulator
MLVLSRKPSQAIQIGDNIKVTIVEIKGNQIKVAIEAPSSVRILRSELCEFWVDEDPTAKSDRPRLGAERPVPLLATRRQNRETAAAG